MLMRYLQREFRLCFYHRLSIFNVLLFFLVLVSLFPLSLSPNKLILQLIGPGVIWVCALLTMLLSMQHFFKNDYQDGSLDHWILSSLPLSYYVFVKALVHWLWLILPLIVITPLIGLLYQLSWNEIFFLIVTLLLGTPSLILIAAVLAALTVQLSQNSVLILLMALPLYVPILIFGAGGAPLGFLSAIFVLSITLLPVTTATCLRYSVRV